jgi:hypothetical protein
MTLTSLSSVRYNIVRDKGSLIIFSIVILIGLSAAIYLYQIDKYSLIYYNDSISHLVRSREFVDSPNPGLFEQLGTAWLPLPHLLLLPFTLIDVLFRTGFAGLAVSLPCFAITSVLLYRIIKSHIGAGFSYIAIIGALLYASNPNMIYISITPMTEAPFMLFFVASAYYFQKWYQNTSSSSSSSSISSSASSTSSSLVIENSKSTSREKSSKKIEHHYPPKFADLIKCSIFIVLASLCRYEAWILPLFLPVFVTSLMVKNRRTYDITYKALAISLSLLSLSGIVLWVMWNAYHYGDPFEFQNAQFWSAAFQAKEPGANNNVYHQPLNAASTYTLTALFMYGPVLLIAALTGYIFDVYLSHKEQKKKSFLYLFLLLPPVLIPISLVIGNAELNTRSMWYNSRFLIVLSPLIVLLVCVLIARLRQSIIRKNYFIIVGAVLIGAFFISQLAVQSLGGVVTFLDAKFLSVQGSRPFAVKAAESLGSSYKDNGGKILLIVGSAQQNKIRQASGIALKNFDTILNNDTLKASFKQPWLYANYIVIGKKADLSGATASKYWLDRQELLNIYFDTIYDDNYYMVMAKKKPHPLESVQIGNTTRTYIIHQR